VRYFDSTSGINSVSMNLRNLSAPPLVGKRTFGLPGSCSTRVGVRSRVRSVFVTPTTIISGMRALRARNETVPLVCWMCASPSVM
jgi:hypothetical protein